MFISPFIHSGNREIYLNSKVGFTIGSKTFFLDQNSWKICKTMSDFNLGNLGISIYPLKGMYSNKSMGLSSGVLCIQ